jgi:hypothetical protein
LQHGSVTISHNTIIKGTDIKEEGICSHRFIEMTDISSREVTFKMFLQREARVHASILGGLIDGLEDALLRNKSKIWCKTLGVMLLSPNNMLVTTNLGHSCTHGVQYWIIMVIPADLPIILKGGMIFSFGQIIFRQIQVSNIIFVVKDMWLSRHVRGEIVLWLGLKLFICRRMHINIRNTIADGDVDEVPSGKWANWRGESSTLIPKCLYWLTEWTVCPLP